MRILQRLKREMESADHIAEIALNCAIRKAVQHFETYTYPERSILATEHHVCMGVAKRHKLLASKLRHYYHQLK